MSTVSGSRKSVTLRDIAARVEVDIATVSRALAGEAGVGKEKGDQIRAYAQAMGYRPKPLRRKRADAIGLIVNSPDRQSPNIGYHERMLYNAEVGAARLGKHLHVHMQRLDAEEGAWPKFISESRVDGVLVVGHGTHGFYERLKREPVPAVAINDTTGRTGVDCVLCDPTPGVQDAVKRLLSLQHRSIGIVLTQRQFPTVSRRYEAYMTSMREAGIEPDVRWLVQDVPLGLRGGQQAIRTYVAGGAMPSAIIFNDDWVAMGGLYELARQGLRVPEDVSVIGYDNSAMAAELAPSLNSIDNREQALMAKAIEMLQQRIEGLREAPRQEVLPSQLVWRESCTRARAAAKS